MSNGRPPFPPFRPHFAPPGGASMPPFPPNSGQGGPGQGGPGRQGPGGGGQGGYAPPGSYPQPAYGAGSGPGPGPGSGGRYPPSGYGGPNHGHGGGGHGGHGGHGLPRPPTLPNTPRPGVGAGAAAGGPPRRAGEDVKTTKIFVGSIAPGITDRTLRDLLNACGPLHELKRVEGAGGKPQAFGFASFESPEDVLRCIRCLNGVELPDVSPEGRRGGNAKALVVKADQKTAAFLQEFEETLGRSESDEDADAQCRKAIANIVARLNEAHGRTDDRASGGLSPIQVIVPAHLQDLKEGDLPEAQRVAVLDQIAIFRENAARREREKKISQEDRERYMNMPSSHVEYGYGTRALPKETSKLKGREERERERDGGRDGGRDRARDPQGYSDPVAFVRAETAEGKGESERTDEEDEAVRQQQRERERAQALRDREHRVESRERQRIENAMREDSVQQQRAEQEARARRAMVDELEHWDDAELEARGKELFYRNRSEWRTQRQHKRQRESDDDGDDRRREDAEGRALAAESEDFLRQQAAEFASLEGSSGRQGLLSEDAAPIKVALALSRAPEQKEEKKSAPAPTPRAALALGDDDDDGLVQKKKRALVKLEYEAGLDAAQKKARETAQLIEISKRLPSSKGSVFRADVNWAVLEKPRTRSKILGLVERNITSALGELDQDLVDFVMGHLEGHKGPEELVDELSPVLAEEADGFAVQLWRQLAFESQALAHEIDTGDMKV